MPRPVSLMLISANRPSTRLASVTVPPSGEYLTALLTMLLTTWIRRSRSPVTIGSLGSRSDLNSTEVDRKSTRLNSSHPSISYAVFCLKKKKTERIIGHVVASLVHLQVYLLEEFRRRLRLAVRPHPHPLAILVTDVGIQELASCDLHRI